MGSVTILKNTRRQAVVKFLGTGSNTITLPNVRYANASPVLYPGTYVAGTIDQVLDQPNSSVTINDIVYSVSGNVDISREGTTIITLTEGQDSFSLSQYFGAVLAEKANANITANFGASNGFVILSLTKGDGFNDPDRQNLEAYQR